MTRAGGGVKGEVRQRGCGSGGLRGQEVGGKTIRSAVWRLLARLREVRLRIRGS